MRRILLGVAVYVAILAIAACSIVGPADTLPGVPGVTPTEAAPIADRTALDEQGIVGVELAYKMMRVALEAATDAGQVTGARAEQLAELDRRAFAAVQGARAAYAAGNAASYAVAVTSALAAVERAGAAIRGEQP